MTAQPPVPGRRAAALAREALALRGWALGALSGCGPLLPPEASAEGWEVFLTAERCAHPLRVALAAADVLERLPPPAAAALERHGVREAKHLLSLRLEAATLSRLLAARGWQGLVLKGGAALLAGEVEVDVRDLDLLLEPAQVAPLVAALDAAGYQHEGPDFAPGDANRHEVGARIRPGSIAVDLHFAMAPALPGLEPWEGATALPFPGLLRMQPLSQLRHVLAHATLHHPERRGLLRDLLLVVAGVRACPADRLALVEAEAAAHPAQAALLAMARELAGGAPPRDRLRREAATAYLLLQAYQRYRLRNAVLLPLARTAFALAAGGPEYRRLWYGTPVSVIPRGYTGGSRVDRVLPGIATLGRPLWRGAHLLLMTPQALWIARTAARLAAG